MVYGGFFVIIKRTCKIYRYVIVVLVCMPFLSSPLCAADFGDSVPGDTDKVITILTTTDIHGAILSYDYNREQEVSNSGLTKLATFIKARRRLDPQLLLLDAGDTFQGNPMVHIANTDSDWKEHPLAVAMNYLKFNAMTPGNHDFDYGMKNINRISQGLEFDLIAANAIDTRTGKSYWKPYTICTANGVKVGILGLTSMGIKDWLPPSKWEGIEFTDPVECAKKYVQVLKDSGCSIVVVSFHGGPAGKHPGVPDYVNSGLHIAETVPEIDLLILGHTHEIVNAKFVGNTMILQAGSYSHCIGEAKFRVVKGISGYEVVRSSGRIFKVSDKIPPDRDLQRLMKPYHEKTLRTLGQELVSVDKGVSLKDAAYKDNELMDLISDIQKEYTGADLSLCSVFDPYASVEDQITIRKLFKLYPYENDLFMLKMTGAQIKTFLENAASAYIVRGNEIGIQPEFPLFNLDVLSGLSYEIDPLKPVGERIVHLNDRGVPVKDDATYTVAMNSYRAGGSGGYDVVKECEVLFRSDESVRDIIINHLKRKKFITMTKDDNWKLILPFENMTFEQLAR